MERFSQVSTGEIQQKNAALVDLGIFPLHLEFFIAVKKTFISKMSSAFSVAVRVPLFYLCNWNNLYKIYEFG